ncbi:MAG: flagellar biosynthesis [Candidatus Latescibacteria bacterium]|nr:flagellar biosynthesis [Candidatus Latescibacterota bacterium]
MDNKRDATSHRKAAAALRYRRDTDVVPRVTAAGRGLVAEKIIALAKEAGIPIHEDASLVEVLARLDVGSEIPVELYRVVAEILAFVYRMDRQWKEIHAEKA